MRVNENCTLCGQPVEGLPAETALCDACEAMHGREHWEPHSNYLKGMQIFLLRQLAQSAVKALIQPRAVYLKSQKMDAFEYLTREHLEAGERAYLNGWLV